MKGLLGRGGEEGDWVLQLWGCTLLAAAARRCAGVAGVRSGQMCCSGPGSCRRVALLLGEPFGSCDNSHACCVVRGVCSWERQAIAGFEGRGVVRAAAPALVTYATHMCVASVPDSVFGVLYHADVGTVDEPCLQSNATSSPPIGDTSDLRSQATDMNVCVACSILHISPLLMQDAAMTKKADIQRLFCTFAAQGSW